MGKKATQNKSKVETTKRLTELLAVLKTREQTDAMKLRITDVEQRLKELV